MSDLTRLPVEVLAAMGDDIIAMERRLSERQAALQNLFAITPDVQRALAQLEAICKETP